MLKASFALSALILLASCADHSGEKNVHEDTTQALRTIQSSGDTIDLKIGDMEPFAWKLRPEKGIDVIQIYCSSDEKKDVVLTSEIETALFQVSGLDYVEFVMVNGDGNRLNTAIECFPEPINFKGDYAVTSGDNRNYIADLNSGTLDAHILEMREKRIVPGLAVAVVENENILFQKSYGFTDTEESNPFTNNTPSRIASATKFLTMLTVVSLVEENVIDINERLGTYLPSVRQDWSDIPIWRMLNHTSGIPEILSNKAFLALSDEGRKVLSFRQLFDMIKDQALDYEPGSSFRYQQSAYTIIAMVLTERTGESWDELVRKHVIEPANMTNTNYGDWLTDHPQSYNLSKGELISPPYYYPPTLSTGAGYNASSNDLVNLIMALNTGKIVSLAFLENIAFHDQYLPGEQGYGVGTVVKIFGEVLTMGHSGGGDMADIRYIPEKGIGVFVISNREGSDIASAITTEISELLFGAQKPQME